MRNRPRTQLGRSGKLLLLLLLAVSLQFIPQASPASEPGSSPGKSLDPRDFGAIGDGLTDDTAAIQTALNVLASSTACSTLKLGGRTYRISGTCPLSPRYDPTMLMIGSTDARATPMTRTGAFTVDGEGGTLITSATSGSRMLLVIPRLPGFSIRNLTFQRDPPGPFSMARGRTSGTYCPGLGITPFSNQEDVLSVSLKNVNFIDCHRALDIDDPQESDVALYGRLKNLVIDGCDFIFPRGSNLNLTGSEGGGQAFAVSPWVANCRVTNCYFDGASTGDCSTNPPNHFGVDGFFFGNPMVLQFSGNTLRHFCVEGVLVLALCGTGNASYGPQRWAQITNNEFDGTPVQESGTTFRYGNPAIVVANVKADIESNYIHGCATGINLNLVTTGTPAVSVTPGYSEKGTMVADNTIETLDITDPRTASAGETGAIWASYNGAIVRNNTIRVRATRGSPLLWGADKHPEKIVCIGLGGNDILVSGNVLSVDPIGTGTTAGFGINVANGRTGSIMEGNSTSGFYYGIGPEPGQNDSSYTVKNHRTQGDTFGVIVTGSAVYEHQEVTFTPPEPGWYRIQNLKPFWSGRLRWDAADAKTGTYVDADLQVASGAYEAAAFVTQNAFYASPANPPYADKLFVGGAKYRDRFVKINYLPVSNTDPRPRIVPIKLISDTNQPGVSLLESPVEHINVTRVSGTVQSGSCTITIHTALPHGLIPGPTGTTACYLFDTQCDPPIDGQHSVTVTNSNEFTLVVPSRGSFTGTSGSHCGEFFSSVYDNCSSKYPGGFDHLFRLSASGIASPATISGSGASKAAEKGRGAGQSGSSVSNAVSTVLASGTLTVPGSGCKEISTPLRGASPGDTVLLGLPIASGAFWDLVFTPYVSAADTVTVRARNLSTRTIHWPYTRVRVTILTAHGAPE